jgi:methylenetetrahydrofolate dehydrogenase (NADP+)/methenyltetrahydrofolate cyclohydrolase
MSDNISAKLIDGKKIAAEIKNEIAAEVRQMEAEGKRCPHLAAILVGDDGASKTYVASKEKASNDVGFTSSVYRYPENISEKELLEAVDFLNNDPEIDGFIIQLPLPKHINESKVIEAVSPSKDVDGFNPVNVGKMILGFSTFLPATPFGIQMLLERTNIDTVGKHCVVLGRSNIVGTPMANMLSRNAANANCTVTLCHSKTQNLSEITRQADILIVAIGKPFFVKADMVKEGAVVIDVGMNRSDSGKLCGDVDFENVEPICSAITPVPGGVGPMTICMLMQNTLTAAKRTIK